LDNRWLRLVIVAALVLLSAFCFVRYLSWAFAYSATLGLDIPETRLSHHRVWFFLCMFIMLEILSAAVLGSAWEPSNLGSAGLRFVARYGSALALCLLATGVVVGLRLALVR
jgi:hypothetical protein